MTASLARVLQPFVTDFLRRVESIPGEADVTSWLRTPAVNAAKGGAFLSQHLVGLALDIVPRGKFTATGDPAWRALMVERAKAAGLVALDEGDHVHLQRFRAEVAGPFIRAARDAGLL